MPLIAVPQSLRFAALSLFIHVPIMAFYELLMTQKAEWDQILTEKLFILTGATFLLFLPLYWGILKLKKVALCVFLGFHLLWFLMSLAFSVYLSTPSLSFFGLTLFALSGLQFLWLLAQLQGPFLDPKVTWYQACPKAIPEIFCEIKVESLSQDTLSARMSRLGEEGLFLFFSSFLNKEVWEKLCAQKEVVVLLRRRDQVISFSGKPILKIPRFQGLGVQWLGLSPDQKKELSDWIHELQATGHFLEEGVL